MAALKRVPRFSPIAVTRHLPAYWRGFSRYVYRKRRGAVAANIAVVDYRPVYREAYRDWTHELLEPGRSHLEAVVRPEVLQQLLANLDAGTPSPKRLGPLAALELWCRS